VLATGGEVVLVVRAPRLPELLDATGVPLPNRTGGSETIGEPGLPENVSKTNLPFKQVYHTRGEGARAQATARPPHARGSNPDACGGLFLSPQDFGPAGCPSYHWGVLLTGKLVVRFPDREETITAGQAFYMEPGHAVEVLEACEELAFTPSARVRELLDAERRNAQALPPSS
jgi:hypothetical protein